MVFRIANNIDIVQPHNRLRHSHLCEIDPPLDSELDDAETSFPQGLFWSFWACVPWKDEFSTSHDLCKKSFKPLGGPFSAAMP